MTLFVNGRKVGGLAAFRFGPYCSSSSGGLDVDELEQAQLFILEVLIVLLRTPALWFDCCGGF